MSAWDPDLKTDTRAVLAAFTDMVQSTDRYPTKDTLGDARTTACLEHAADLAARPSHESVFGEITRLHPGPGDLIAVRLTRHLTPDQVRMLTEQLGDHLAAYGCRVLVLPLDMQDISVHAPGDCACRTPAPASTATEE